MTVAAVLLSLLASASPPVPRAHIGPASMALFALQEAPPAEAPAFGAGAPTAEPLPAEEPREEPTPPSEEELIDGRRRPDLRYVLPERESQYNPGAIRLPPPEAFPTDYIPIPDRWRLIDTLGMVRSRWYDPYNQNVLKGDRPICIPTDEEQERRRAAGILRQPAHARLMRMQPGEQSGARGRAARGVVKLREAQRCRPSCSASR